MTLLTVLLVIACVGNLAAAQIPVFSDPVPVTELNSTETDTGMWVSPDGLECWFSSDRDDAATMHHIYYSTRAGLSSPWGAPVQVTEIDNAPRQAVPFLSDDLLTMYFTSHSPGWLSDQSAWEVTRPTSASLWNTASQRWLPGVNDPDYRGYTSANQVTSGGEVMLFAYRRAAPASWDLYRAVRNSPAEDFVTSEPIVELNDPNAHDLSPWITSDGLMVFFQSDRSGGKGSYDIYVAVRDSVAGPFGPPVNLWNLNGPYWDGSTRYHEPTKTLYFCGSPTSSQRDLYAAQLVDYHIEWSTFAGGGDMDRGFGIDTDPEGNVYALVEANSADFPTSGAWDSSFNGTYDNAVMKFTASGELIWSTFVGGSSSDGSRGIAVDSSRCVYITGATGSADYPTSGAFDSTVSGSDAFLTKLDPDGQLIWSTYFGGSGTDSGLGIAVDDSGGVYIRGTTESSDFPTSGADDNSLGGSSDVFVAKFDSDGALRWSTYLGGSGQESGSGYGDNGIVFDPSTNAVYVPGWTDSGDFPQVGPNSLGHTSGHDVFVAAFSTTGTLLWTTQAGGGGEDHGSGVAADGAGNIYVSGWTASADFPTTNGYDTTYNGSAASPWPYGDGFVARLTSDGAFVWSTYLGGSQNEAAYTVDTDADGNAYVSGSTLSPNFPTLFGLDTTLGGSIDVFVSKFNPGGELLWSTFLGGSDSDGARVIAVGPGNSIHLTGSTYSADFPTTNGFDMTYNGGIDASVMKLTSGTMPLMDVWPLDPVYLTIEEGSQAPGVVVNVSNAGSGTLDYSITTSSTVSAIAHPASGQSTGETNKHLVVFDTPDLTPGIYNATITVGGNSLNGPFQIAVQITVTPTEPDYIDLEWSTFAGGGNMDRSFCVDTDSAGNVYALVETQSSDFPTSGAWDSSLNGSYDNAVMKFTASGELVWSTFVGGSSGDGSRAIAVDPSGCVYITGATTSPDYPTSGAFDSTVNGSDAYLTKLDPDGQLIWSTYFGGSDTESGLGVAVDASGGVYLRGVTWSTDFPTSGAYDNTLGGSYDDFVAKFDSNGALCWATYLGGSANEGGSGYGDDGIVWDAATNAVYLSGVSSSSDFPQVGPNSLGHTAGDDAFVAAFSPDGTLLWTTMLGGGGEDNGSGVAADGMGNVYVSGWTVSNDFPTMNGYDMTYNGDNSGLFPGGDGFVAKLSADGQLVWSTYLGGSSTDPAYSIDTDSLGNVYVGGNTWSSDFPTSNALDSTLSGGADSFVAKFNAAGKLVFSTFLGGSGLDGARGIAVSPGGGIHLVSDTPSTDFPMINSYDPTHNGNLDVAIAKLTPGVAPEIATSPTQIVVTVPEGASGVDVALEISNSGGSALEYTLVTSPTWLTCTPVSGHIWSSAIGHTVSVNSAGLNPGSYAGALTVNAATATTPTVGIPVLLQVNDVPPTVTLTSVSPNPAVPQVDTVLFEGSAQDGAGAITAYEWLSSLDGVLDTGSSFSMSADDLTVGDHAVRFAAWDDEGSSSSEATTLTVENVLPTASLVIHMPGPVAAGTTVTLVLGGQDGDERNSSLTDGELTLPDGVHSGAMPGKYRFAAPLAVGAYTIEYRVQDDEGTWSQLVTAELTVVATTRSRSWIRYR